MELRFETAPDHAYDLMKAIMREYFPELASAEVLILMDLKKRMTGEAIILGRIVKTNDLTRHLTIDESGTERGYDYIIFLDKLMWDNIDDTDKSRVIRHELRHTSVDDEAKKNPYKLRIHTIEDFYSEVDLNTDDPRWRERVAAMVNVKYNSMDNADVTNQPGLF
jgi:hypothetical protein